jgi:hypothetical protein
MLTICNCTTKKEEVIKITNYDKIDSINDSIFFGTFTSIDVLDGEVFCHDNVSGSIVVFDAETFRFKRIFGEKGKAPGEFNFVHSIIKKSDDELWVAETFNQRIQKIDKFGLNIGNRKTMGVWKMQKQNDRLFCNNYAGMPEPKIFEITNDDELKPIFNIKEYFEKEKIDAVDRAYSYFVTDNEEIIISFFQKDKLSKFDKESNELTFSYPAKNFYKVYFGGIRQFKDNYIVAGNIIWEKPKNESETEDLSFTNFLALYNNKGELIKRFDLPKELKGIDISTWDLWEDNVFLFDLLNSNFCRVKISS